MQYRDARILIFCKAPLAGKVKTRLAKGIGDSAAKIVHEHLARHCVERLTEFAIAPIELWCTPDTNHEFFRKCQNKYGVSLKQQVGASLGERMQYALSETLQRHSPVVLVGTDCPAITADYVRKSIAAAIQNKTVIGPAEDGGYVLLCERVMQADIFKGIPWGTSNVFNETMKRLSGKNEILDTLWDIDHVSDLKRLQAEARNLHLNDAFKAYLSNLNLS